MRDSEKTEFARLWKGAQEATGGTVTADSLAVVWAMLKGYELADIRIALSRHMADPERGQYSPKPADIVREMRAQQPQHISADEAWAIAIQAADERATIVWTNEMQNAWIAAQPIHSAGDAIGARLAFREAYKREIANAGEPVWFASVGWDAEHRAVAIHQAIQAKRLTADQARALLPAPRDLSPAVAALAGLIAGKPVADAREHTPKLREAIDQATQRQAQREATARAAREQRQREEAARRNELFQQSKQNEGDPNA